MNKKPATVSIIIANHNYGQFIESCLKSAINQEYLNVKIVVIDDASTDNSVEIIDKIAETDFRITPIYRKECGGASVARNQGILRAWDESDYFLILDADDEIKPNKITELLKRAIISPTIGVVYADYDILNIDTGNIIREFKEPYSLSGLQKSCIVHSGSLISKLALEKTKEYDEQSNISFYDKNLHGPASQNFIGCCEDYDLWLRISEQFLIIHVPMSLSLVRVHDNNASKIEKVNTTWQKNIEYIQKKVAERANHISKN